MMHRPFTAQPRAVAGLIRQLESLALDLPDDLAHAAALLEDATDGTLTREVSALPEPTDVLGMDRADLLGHLRAHAAMRLAHDRLADSVAELASNAATAAAQAIREHADDLIAQLAPRFTEAADAVHAAARTGIAPGMSPAAVLALGSPKAMAAWNALPAALTTLDDIAAARIAMTDHADVAPSPDSWGPRQYGACFAEGALWQREDGQSESSADRWLRLCGSQPARLLDTATTEAGALKWRREPKPAVTWDVNGTPEELAELSRAYGRR